MPIPPIKISIVGIDRFTKQLGASMKRLNRMGAGMKSVGRNMSTGLTMPIVGAGIAIVKTATDFQSSMNKVKALTQETGKPLKQMSDLAKKLGLKTAFSAGEAADAMSFLGMAGFKTNEILVATPELLNLAAASNTELARTADISSNMMGRFGLKAEDMGYIADVLATATASANVDMEMLEETMKKVGPIASRAGMDLKETATFAGFLGNAGIQASLGGTALTNMITRLAAPASKASKIMKHLDITTKDAKGKFLGLVPIIKDLSGKMSNMGSATQIEVLDALFGKRAIAGAGILTADLKRTNSGFAALSRSMDNFSGRAKTTADIMMEGAPGAFKRFTSAMQGMAIAIADSGLLDFVSKIAEGFAKMFKKISDISPSILKMATVFLGLVAILGPLIWMLGGVISAMASMGGAIASAGGIMGIIMNPITWIIVGVIALIAVVTLLAKNWKSKMAQIVFAIFPFLAIVTWIITRWKRLLPFFKLFVFAIVGVFKLLWYLLKPVLMPIANFMAWIGKLMFKVLDGILGVIEKLTSLVLPKWLQKKIGLQVGGKIAGEGAQHDETGNLIAKLPGAGGTNTTNIKIEDKAGVKLTTDVEKGDVNTEVHRGLQNTGTD